MIKCPNCGGECRMQVQATIAAPSSMMHQLSKSNLRSAGVTLMGVNWETADHYCQSCKLMVKDGYGNYVTKLESDREKFILLQAELGKLFPPQDGDRANDSILVRVRRYLRKCKTK